MNTKTSYFNKKIFMQNLLHALPFIGIFALIIIYVPLVELQNTVRQIKYLGESPVELSMKSTLLDTICLTGIQFLLVFYSFGCALWVFRYLFAHRLCKTIHALPLSRSCLFITNILSGAAILLLPLLFASIVFCIYLLLNGFAAGFTLTWLLLSFAYCLFFFGLAVFAVMLSGHLVAVPVIYFILNFGFFLLQFIFRLFVNLFFYGAENLFIETENTIFSPFLHIATKLNFNWEKEDFSPGAIQMLLIYAACGILLCVISLFFYKRRALESQGDPIVTKKLQPVIHYFCTVLGGSLFSLLFSELFLETSGIRYIEFSGKLLLGIFFLLGSAISYYLLKMLLYKTLRVFKMRNKGLGLYLIISVLALLLIDLDVFGIETYQPEESDVVSMDIEFENSRFETADKELIKQFYQMHKELIDSKEDIISAVNHEGYSVLTLTYQTKGGPTLTRSYCIPYVDNTTSAPVKGIYDRLFDILDDKTFLLEQLSISTSEIMNINVSKETYNTEYETFEAETFSELGRRDFAGLTKAIEKDIAAGNMKLYMWIKPEKSLKDTLYTIDICYLLSKQSVSDFTFMVTKDCVHTLEYIKKNNLDEPNVTEVSEVD